MNYFCFYIIIISFYVLFTVCAWLGCAAAHGRALKNVHYLCVCAIARSLSMSPTAGDNYG